MALAAPALPTAERRRTALSAVSVYWHLLSLDAPTVAVLWAWLFSRMADVPAARGTIAVLGIGTWLIYVADRLLDARPGSGKAHLRERHFFHARHRARLLPACAAAVLPLLWLIAFRMTSAARREDTTIFAASMLYFAVVHIPALPVRRWFPRELAVGILFACATAVPAWSQPRSPRAELALPILLFAALCCLNCLAIETWEGQEFGTRGYPVSTIACCLAGAAAALIVASEMLRAGEVALYAAILLSSVFLLLLDQLRYCIAQRIPSGILALRIAADAVLLTPLLFLSWRA